MNSYLHTSHATTIVCNDINDHDDDDDNDTLQHNTIQYNAIKVFKAPSKFAERSSETETPTTIRR